MSENVQLEGPVGHLSKTELERIYCRVWACGRWFWRGSRKAGFCSGWMLSESRVNLMIKYLKKSYFEGESR